jgi:hypothetical protein
VEEPPTETSPTDTDAIVVGVLHRHGVFVCAAGAPPDRGRWVDIHPVVGFVPLIAEQQAHDDAQALYGKIVSVRGRVREGRPLVPEPGTNPCSRPMQMRSDWVSSVDGIRVQRKPPALPAFAAAKIETYDGLRAQQRSDSVEIVFENQLGRALAPPVVVRAHYEGCYGKPGTTEIEHRAESGLPAGKTFSATFPLFETRPDRPKGREGHVISSIEIVATGDRIWFDFDAPVRTLGITVSCR